MSDAELKQAMAELQEVVRCRCDEAYRDRGLKDPHCECDSAEAVKIVADRIKALTAKLAGGVIAEYDDGSTIFLSGYAGGAADGGAWSTLTLMEEAPDGTLREREYKAQGDWRATLAEIKGESHD